MPFITATREDGATLLVNLDRIQYVAYQDAAGHEVGAAYLASTEDFGA